MYKPETLEKAYAGADVLFLVSYPSVGPERFELHKNAIDAAVKVGVKHILYTSLAWGRPGIDDGSVAGVLKAHLNTAQYLAKVGEEKGITWTVIREAIYTHIWSNAAGFVSFDGPKDKVIDAVFPVMDLCIGPTE
jgi:NAD(P)H dehydrogenase (quinone)